MVGASASLAGYAEERSRIIGESPPGQAAARDLSRATDEAVAGLTAAASRDGSPRVAVLALGGYGAGRLTPASDIDLLVVTDRSAPALESFTRAVFYPFWDLGLEVGHQVRSRAEHVHAIREDVQILAATLTARHVAGDTRVSERVLRDSLAWAHRKRRHVLAEIETRERPGSPYLLEPDIKEGAGGQRDLDELVWLAALLTGRPQRSPDVLVDEGLLDRDESERLARAQAEILEARWRLHVAADRPSDVVTLDAAAAGGVRTERLQAALADVHHLLIAVRRRREDPTLAQSSAEAPRAWSAERLLETLARGPEALPVLEEAAWSGSLKDVLPGIRARMTLRRPGLSHRLTVGAHSLQAAVSVATLADGDRFAEQLLASVPDRTPLLLAALVHDFGKDVAGPGHESRGAELAADVSTGFGLHRPLVWGVETLVREHLLLSRTAAEQDLADEDVVLRAAARLGDRSLVGPLYLLTKADMLATGPEVWTPWRATVLRELTVKLDDALSDDVDGAGIIAAASRVRDASLRQATGAGMERSALVFLEEAPLRYLASREPQEVLRHARLVRELRAPLGHGGLVVDVSPGTADDTWRLTVVTRDGQGLFARIAGAITLADLDILGAEAFTETSGVVLDVFTVGPATLAAVEEDRWRRLEETLRGALAGVVDVEERLAERRRYHRHASSPAEVEIVRSGPLATVLHVRAADRVGLLHDLARTLEEHELDIRLAAAESRNGRVSDVFHIVDAQGSPPQDDEVLDRLRDALIATAEA
jgi:[protein-PII] uridylyltransferase